MDYSEYLQEIEESVGKDLALKYGAMIENGYQHAYPTDEIIDAIIDDETNDGDQEDD